MNIKVLLSCTFTVSAALCAVMAEQLPAIAADSLTNKQLQRAIGISTAPVSPESYDAKALEQTASALIVQAPTVPTTPDVTAPSAPTLTTPDVTTPTAPTLTTPDVTTPTAPTLTTPDVTTPTVPTPTTPDVTTPTLPDPTVPAPTIEPASPPVDTTLPAPTVPGAETAPLPAPTPGTPSAEPLQTTPTTPPSEQIAPLPGDGSLLEGRLQRRYIFNYVGLGANLGIGGDNALGNTSFAIYSRFAFNPFLSARPSILIEENVSILLPVTYDFPITGPGQIAPFVGGGLEIGTGEDSNFDLLLTGGIDYPISESFNLTAALNVSPFDSFDIGILLGASYAFGGRTVIARDIDAAQVSDRLGTRRRNPSYIGIGGNFGITGDAAIGDTGFAILGKITLGESFSVRPSVLFAEDVAILGAATYDFPAITTDFLTFAPYVGGGININLGDNDDFDFLLTAGVDVPITDSLAFTTGFNVGPFEGFDLGLTLGVVYTFGSF